MMRKNGLVLLAIIFLLIISGSCNAQDKEIPSYIKKDWKGLLERVRNGKGHAHGTDGLYTKWYLKNLRKYLEIHKEKIYKGDEIQWLYDNTMIDLMYGNFIECFIQFREYIELTGDDIKPWFYVGMRIASKDFYMKEYFYEMCLYKAIKNKEHQLSIEEMAYLLKKEQYHFLALMPEIKIYKEIKESEMYLCLLKDDIPLEEMIKNYDAASPLDAGCYLNYPQWFIEERERKRMTDMEVSMIYRYYFYKKNYREALRMAEDYDFGIHFTGNAIYSSFFYQSILEVFYRLNEYDWLLDFFYAHEDNSFLINRERTFCSGYFWVAAVYAQKKEFDKSLSYIQKAFDATTLLNSRDFQKHIKMNTLSLIWHIIITDYFDPFREAGRFDEIEALMRKNLEKYKDLDYFN